MTSLIYLLLVTFSFYLSGLTFSIYYKAFLSETEAGSYWSTYQCRCYQQNCS